MTALTCSCHMGRSAAVPWRGWCDVLTARTRSQIGRANRRRGIDAERRVATWLRAHGWPGAERAVRTGYRTATRASADPGDITGTPGLAWQVKDCAREQVDAWLAETEEQAEAAGADYGLLVVRRRRVGDVGRWWVYMRLADLGGLLVHAYGDARFLAPGSALVRLELRELVRYLHDAGYGDPTESPTTRGEEKRRA